MEDLTDMFEAPDDLIDFLSRKCRAYFVSPKPAGTVVEGRVEFGCNSFASGETLNSDSAIVRCWGSMLDHFNAVHTLQDFEEPVRYAEEEVDEAQASPPN